MLGNGLVLNIYICKFNMNTLSLLKTHRCLREIMHEVDPQWWSQLWTRPGMHHIKKELCYKPYYHVLSKIIPEIDYLNEEALVRKFNNSICYIPDSKYTIVPDKSRDYQYIDSATARRIHFKGKRTYRTVATLPLIGAPVGKIKITFDDGTVEEGTTASQLIVFNIYKNPQPNYNEHCCLVLPLSVWRAVLLDDTVSADNNYILNNRIAVSKIFHSGMPEECLLDYWVYRQTPSFIGCSTNKVPSGAVRSNLYRYSKGGYCVHKQALLDTLNKDIVQLSGERENAIQTIREICKSYL